MLVKETRSMERDDFACRFLTLEVNKDRQGSTNDLFSPSSWLSVVAYFCLIWSLRPTRQYRRAQTQCLLSRTVWEAPVAGLTSSAAEGCTCNVEAFYINISLPHALGDWIQKPEGHCWQWCWVCCGVGIGSVEIQYIHSVIIIYDLIIKM